MLERFVDILYKDFTGMLPEGASLSNEQTISLLLASAKCAKANLHLLSRSYINCILARRDALLAKAHSRVRSTEKDVLRALPLDASGLLGPKALLSSSLQPLSENNRVLLEVLKTIKPRAPRNTPSEKHKASPAKKRSFSESQGKGKQPAKRFKFGGKGKKDCSSPKPSTSKAAVSPP